MTTILMSTDELYPVPYISEDWGTEVDVPQDLIDRWYATSTEWYKCRNTLLDLLEAAEKKKKLQETVNGRQSVGF